MSGEDYYAQFLEGAGVVLQSPETLLPLLSLGILLGLWHPEGMLRAWPAFLIGLIVGILFAAVVGPWIVFAILGTGLLTAILVAALPRHIRVEAIGLSFILGLLTTAASLEGHGLLELPILIHVGIVFGANLVAATVAGVTRLCTERVTASWMHILWRIGGSWIAAILILMLAFLATAN